MVKVIIGATLTHFKTIFNSVEAAPHRDAAVTLPK
jgi:hypothetical protein